MKKVKSKPKKKKDMARDRNVMRRFIIAVDDAGVHFRKTLCVTHHGESGEITYNAIPILSTHNESIKYILMKMLEILNGA